MSEFGRFSSQSPLTFPLSAGNNSLAPNAERRSPSTPNTSGTVNSFTGLLRQKLFFSPPVTNTQRAQKENSAVSSSPTGTPNSQPKSTLAESTLTPISSTQELDISQLNEEKKKLKNSSKFEEAVNNIADLMKKFLDSGNKQKFYGALTTISFSLGNPFDTFDPKHAKPIFEVALGPVCKPKWSPGYLKNIEQWNTIIDQMIAGTWDPSTYTRGDGRFGTAKTPSAISPSLVQAAPTPVAPRSSIFQPSAPIPSAVSRSVGFSSNFNLINHLRSGNDLLSLFLARNGPFRFCGSSSDDESDESDSDGASNGDNCLTNRSCYPFYSFTSHAPLVLPTKVPHSQDTVATNLSFCVTQQMIDLIQDNYTINLLVYNEYSALKGTKSPPNMIYKVNGNPVSIKGSGKEVEYGYNISSLCVVGDNRLQIIALCFCKNFKFGVRIVKSNVSEILSNVKNSCLSKEQSLEAIRKSFARQGEVMELHITLSLLCPLGQTFIETPVRSRNCKHIQCFDLETFILMNKADPTWTCPVCNIICTHDHLVIDSYMEEILTTVGSDDIGESIKMDQSGKWELFAIEFGDHSESEDEDEIPLKRKIPENIRLAQPPPKRMRTLAPPPKPVVIDLTL